MDSNLATQSSPADQTALASPVDRLRAFLVDYIIILAYILILGGINYGLILSSGVLERLSPEFGSPWIKDLVAFFTLVLPVILYFTFFEAGPEQATWGKRKVGLRVVGPSGGPVRRSQAFLRNLLKFLPWQIAHTSIYQLMALPTGSPPPALVVIGFAIAYALVGLYGLSLVVSKRNRAIYDLIAGTWVVKDHPVIEGLVDG